EGGRLRLDVLFTPWALAGGWDRSGEPTRWLEAFASLCEPGFLDGVRDVRAVTPPEAERLEGHHRGAVPTYGVTPLAGLLGRRGELSRYQTPVRGLFLTGPATYPGGAAW